MRIGIIMAKPPAPGPKTSCRKEVGFVNITSCYHLTKERGDSSE